MVVFAFNHDCFLDAAERLPFATVPVEPWIIGVWLLDEIIHDIGLHIRDAPAKAIVVADNNVGCCGEPGPGDVSSLDREVPDVPQRGQVEAEVRVAAKYWFA